MPDDDGILDQRPAANEPETPVAVAAKPPVPVPQMLLNETIWAHLRNTSPWLRFLGVLGYIGAALSILLGLIMAAAAPFMEELFEILGGAGGIIMGIVYIGLGIAVFFPSRFLYNSGARLRNFFLNYSEQELELALRNNWAFWKFCGILSIISLALIPLGIIVAIILALSNYY